MCLNISAFWHHIGVSVENTQISWIRTEIYFPKMTKIHKRQFFAKDYLKGQAKNKEKRYFSSR